MKNKKYYAVLSMIALAVSFGGIARAENEAVVTTTVEAEDTLTAEAKLRAEKGAYRKEAEERRNKIKDDMRDNKDKIQKERETLRDEMKEKKAKLQIEIEKKRGNQIEQIKERVVRKINAAIERLVNMQTRLETRISKLDIAKVNTVQAKASLAISKQKLADAKVAIETVKTLVATPDMKTSQKVSLVKEAGKKVEVLLKESHKALVEAISSLKTNKDALRIEEKEKKIEIKTSTEAEVKNQ